MVSARNRAILGAFAGVGAFLGVAYLILPLLMGTAWVEGHRSPILVHGAYWWIILLLIYVLVTVERGSFISAPKVLLVMDDGLILCQNSPWLSIGCAVAVYIMENDLERLAGVGEVVNIQTNDLVQVRTENPENPEYVSRMRANLNRVIIKPGLYR
jgi:hypothetical protein